MNRQELSALLAQLHAELANNPPLDEALKQSLQVLNEDIQRVLTQAVSSTDAGDATDTQPLAATPPDTPDASDVQALVQTLETHLEAEHPYLVGTLRELVDRLGKMGI
jgi:hypothetical protein